MFSLAYASKKKKTYENMSTLIPATIPLLCVRTPPGIYADYGWLLIQNNKVDEGVEMLYAEIELYPESEVFITRMLKELGIK